MRRDFWDRFLALLYSTPSDERWNRDYPFSFALPQPMVMRQREEHPTPDELRERRDFAIALNKRWGTKDGFEQPSVDNDIPAQPDYTDIDTTPDDVLEDYEWALDETNFSHPDPTEHGNQGSYDPQVSDLKRIAASTTRRIK
jgi:hypothetical protein